MTVYGKIKKINEVVEKYFNEHPKVDKIWAKDLMPEFMEAGVYASNHRDGLPLRDDLRDWDRENRLSALKYLLVDRKDIN